MMRRSGGSPRSTAVRGRSSSPCWSTATIRSITPAKKTRLSAVPAAPSAADDRRNRLTTPGGESGQPHHVLQDARRRGPPAP